MKRAVLCVGAVIIFAICAGTMYEYWGERQEQLFANITSSCVIVALDMAELAQVGALPERNHALSSPRHSLVVRVTHWINFLAFSALLSSGVAILFAHPRLYWGETGAFGSPALIELPLPLDLDQSGWGRSLHFLSAWVCVLNGAVYLTSGFGSKHFNDAMPTVYTPRQRL